MHEGCSDHLVERFDEQLTFSSAVHSDFPFLCCSTWTLILSPRSERIIICWSSLRKEAAQLPKVSVHHILALLHMPKPGISSWVFIVSSSRFLTKNSLQWVLMEHVGSVPRLPERERRLEVCGWLLIKHDLASISSVILGLIFNDAPHFTFCGLFHLLKWLVCRWTDSCNCEWRTLMRFAQPLTWIFSDKEGKSSGQGC